MAPIFREGDGRNWQSENQRTPIFNLATTTALAVICSLSLLMVIFACGCCCESIGSDGRSKKGSRKAAQGSQKPKQRSSKSSGPIEPLPPLRISEARCEQVAVTFALNWYRALNATEEKFSSLVASPFAIQTAFGLWYLGLNHSLQERTVNVLFPGCKSTGEDVETVLKTLSSATQWWRRRSVRVANRLYVPSSCRYSPSFRRRISNLLGGQHFLQVDFAANASSLVDSVNRWTMAVTKGRAQLVSKIYLRF